MTKPNADYSIQPQPTDLDLSLEARLEALLFVSAAPVPAPRLSETLGASAVDVEQALLRLEQQFERRGLRLQRHRGGFSLTTAPQAASDVAKLLDLESTVHLTRAALETLSIVAYRQPATRPTIDSIRGVNSEASLHTLIRYGLVEESGRSEGPGRPILYVTTQDFLQHFGLRSLAELPQLSPDGGETIPLPIPDEAV